MHFVITDEIESFFVYLSDNCISIFINIFYLTFKVSSTLKSKYYINDFTFSWSNICLLDIQVLWIQQIFFICTYSQIYLTFASWLGSFESKILISWMLFY